MDGPFDRRLGYLPLPRAIREHAIMRRPKTLAFYVWLLTRTRAAPGLVELAGGPLVLARGQAVYGQDEAAKALKVGRESVRSSERWLERWHLIHREANQRGTVATILGYGDFGRTEAADQPANQPGDQPAANQPPTNGQPLRNGEERENGRTAREPRAHARSAGGGPSASRDAYLAAADAIWAEQERAKDELRAAGVDPGSRGLGPVHPAKAELVRRIGEQAADGRGVEAALEACRHVLAVLLAEAKASGQLRWLDGGHWEPKRFAAALSQSPAAARHRAKERREAGAPGAAPPPAPAVNAVPSIEVPLEQRPSADEVAAAMRAIPAFGMGGG